LDDYAVNSELIEQFIYELKLESIQADSYVCLHALLFFHNTEYRCRSPPFVLRFQSHFENLEDKHMSENKKYTIVVKSKRVEVSEAVYHAYHKSREAERYQYKLINQFELSLERFQVEGINVEFLITRFQPSIEDKLIEQQQFQKLRLALATLNPEEKLLIQELFFNGKSERTLSSMITVPQKTINDRKKKILLKLRHLIEN